MVPEKLIKKHTLIPFSLQDNVLTIVMANPMDIMVIDDIQYQTGKQIQEAIGLKTEIQEVINRYFSTSGEEMNQAVQEVALSAEDEGAEMHARKTVDLEDKDSPTVAIVNNMISDAIKMRASDIHVEPHEQELGLRYRLDGVLQERNLKINLKSQGELISRIKLLSGMDISEKRIPQDGRIKVKTPVNDKVVTCDLRVSSLPVYRGEKIVIRILDKTNLNLNLTDVGFSENNLKLFQTVVDKPSGIILMTGPTGSGKTSTLYAALNFVHSPEVNITTVEDPVEFEIPYFNQTQVHVKAGMTFARALRAILRQDPDIILIGEVRDEETAKIAVESALTGHLVFSTLHTNDAPASISRLIEMGVEPYLLSSTVRAIVAQRLVRVLCTKCKIKIQLDPKKCEALAKTYGVETPTLFKPRGCSYCNTAGYRGRTAIHEILTFNEDLAQAVNDGKSTGELAVIAKKTGFKGLAHDGNVKVLQGITTFREVEKVAMG
jgi:type IV pilus assembly protein PilB